MRTGNWWILFFVSLVLPRLAAAAEPAEGVDYVRDVKPILSRRCATCHGALKQKNGLRLDTAALAEQGGDGGPAVVPGNSAESLLIDAVTGANGVPKMPPEGEPLKPEEIETLRKWIDQGAKAPEETTPESPAKHWSYQVPVRPAVPQVANGAWAQNPIDAFIAAEQEKRGLAPSPPAAKHLQLRRVYLDLIGLPPTSEEMATFLADQSSDAYDKVVDRLLDSPHFGERWGRHWMDVWRYSDWDGYGAEVRESQPHIWRWRDWIVESLNADKPYDRMITEMLAGDELAPGDPQTVRATGFLVRNWYKFNRNVWLDYTVEHTAKAFLGTTLNCARCHDHMYDPLAQQDYYRFRAFFEPHAIRTDRLPGQPDTTKVGLVRAFDQDAGTPTFLFTRGDEKRPDKEHPLAAGVPAVLARGDLKIEPVTLAPTDYYPGLRPWVRQEIQTQAHAAVDAARGKWLEGNGTLAGARQKLAGFLAARAKTARPEPRPDAVLLPDAPAPVTEKELRHAIGQAETAVALANAKLATARAALAWTDLRIEADNANYATPPAANAKALSLAAGQAEREHTLRVAEQTLLEAEQKLAAAKSVANPAAEQAKKAIAAAETAVTNALKPRNEAQAALGQPLEAYTRFTPVYPATSSGRRLALARWIADRNNPLTARVAINQIWLRHFGSPLVPTVFDFGLNGKPPTHPQLLDWLAVELMEPAANVSGAVSGTPGAAADKPAGAWRMKHIHRLIVMSNAYRQNSGSTGELAAGDKKIDPDNVYLWRMNVRRMEAEIVRDSTLAVAGQLDPKMAGPEIDEGTGMTNGRRSLYFRNSKEKKMTFLDLFDRPNVVECYRRAESIVPQQALAMANSPLSLAQSRVLARVLSEQVGTDATPERIAAFVDAAFQRILNRAATADERAECAAFLSAQAERFTQPSSLTPFTAGEASPVAASADPHQRARENLVHVLLNHNDFLTVR
jgi:mono/diheme cytochrome c family protein